MVSSGFPSVTNPYFGKKRLELVEKLMERGHTVGVVTLDTVNRCRYETYKDVPVIRIPRICNPPTVYYPLPHISLLKRTLDSLSKSFDVVHYYKQQYLVSLCAYFNVNNRPRVLTIDTFPGIDYEHGVFFWDFAGFAYGMTVTKLLLKKFDRLVSMSRVCKRTAIKLGVEEDKIEWIPHGIDTDKVKPDLRTQESVKEKLGLGGPVFSFVGRLSTVKGIAYLVEAILNLDREGIEGNLLIVGDGPERNKLFALRRSKNIKLHFFGYRRDAVNFIQASDFIVLPSLGEGCPNVVLEALAIGKPVVASRVGGVPDLIKHMETGMIIDAKNVEQLVKSIRTLVTDSHLAETMGRNARKFAEKELDWDVLIGKNEKVYWNAVE